MKYQKIMHLLVNTLNKPTRFRTKYLPEINDDLCRMYNKDSQIKFKSSMLKSILYDYFIFPIHCMHQQNKQCSNR